MKQGWYPGKIVGIRRDWIYNVYYFDTEEIMEKTPESNIRRLHIYRGLEHKPILTSKPLKEKVVNESSGVFLQLKGKTRAILSLHDNRLKMKLVGVAWRGMLEGRAWEGTLKKTNNEYSGELHTEDGKTIKVSGGIYEKLIVAKDVPDIFVFKGQLNEKPFRIELDRGSLVAGTWLKTFR